MMGSSPVKHYTGVHKGAKDHPGHKLEDLELGNVLTRTKKNVGKVIDYVTGKPKLAASAKAAAAAIAATGSIKKAGGKVLTKKDVEK